jgi:hypothetical protein
MASLFQKLKAALGGQAKKGGVTSQKIKFAPAQKIKFAPGKPTPKRSLFQAIKDAFGKTTPTTAAGKSVTEEIRKQIRKDVVKGVPRQPAATQRTGPGYVSPDQLDDFLHAGARVTTENSTNVQAMQYDAEHQLLYIWFNGGTPVRRWHRRYTYSGIGEAMARRFYEAASRGHWTWREIRWPGKSPLQGPIYDPI